MLFLWRIIIFLSPPRNLSSVSVTASLFPPLSLTLSLKYYPYRIFCHLVNSYSSTSANPSAILPQLVTHQPYPATNAFSLRNLLKIGGIGDNRANLIKIKFEKVDNLLIPEFRRYRNFLIPGLLTSTLSVPSFQKWTILFQGV